MLVDPLFYAVAIPAVILLGLAKGGFSGLGLAGVPLMALAVSPVQAASILLPILIVQDAVSVWAFRRTWDRRALAVTLPGAVAGIALGYALAAYVSAAAVELAVGLISMIFALRRLGTARHPLAPVRHAPAWFGLPAARRRASPARSPTPEDRPSTSSCCPEGWTDTSSSAPARCSSQS